MGKINLFLFLFVFFIAFSGCIQQSATQQSIAETARQACIELCNSEKAKGTDFSNGPCIGNPLKEASDFVCDIAHNPRTAIDNLQENQCSAFREGKARYFVELDMQCNLFRVV